MTTTPDQTTDAGAPADLEDRMNVLSQELTQDLELRLEGDAPARVQALAGEIDPSDTNSIIFFGTKAQEQLTELSEQMFQLQG